MIFSTSSRESQLFCSANAFKLELTLLSNSSLFSSTNFDNELVSSEVPQVSCRQALAVSSTWAGKCSFIIIKDQQQISMNEQFSSETSGILQLHEWRQPGCFGICMHSYAASPNINRYSVYEYWHPYWIQRQCLISCSAYLYLPMFTMGNLTDNVINDCILNYPTIVLYNPIQIKYNTNQINTNSNSISNYPKQYGSVMSQYQMSEKLSAEEKRKRRTRNDEDGRNFSCNCGKSYLSYPALYTHIKTKHGGKPSQLGSMNKISERDQSGGGDIIMEENAEDQQERVDEAANMEQLKKFLLKFFPFTQKQGQKRGKQLSKQDANLIKVSKQYWQKHKKQEQPHENQCYSTTVDHVLGKFLLDFETDTSKNSQKFITQFILDMREGINKLKPQSSGQFCTTNSAATLPSLMNDLWTEKFSKMPQHPIYARHPTIVCKVMFHFSKWLFHSRFTNLNIKFNSI